MSHDPVREVEARIVAMETTVARDPAAQSWWKAAQGSLWCEWYAHSKLLLFFLGAWVASVWVLPLYVNPAWILLFGGLYALVAGPIALAALQVGFWYEDFVWDTLNGFFSCPMLLVLAATVLWTGHRAYSRKEIGHPCAPLTIPARWWLWIVLFIAGLLLALTLASSLAKHYPRFFAATEQR